MVKIKKQFNAKNLTTFKLSGKVRYFVEIKNERDLFKALEFAKEKKIPVFIIASGSNIVFSDKLLNGLLIKINTNNLELQKNKILADAGVPLSRIIKLSLKKGLKGLEFLSGIPGTIGGAVIGNAGAYGHSISEVVERVEVWDGKSKRWLNDGQCRFNYRDSVFKRKQYIILRVLLKFEKGDIKKLQKTSREIIELRSKKYPSNLYCPGSFFKNPLVKNISKKSLRLVDKKKIIGGNPARNSPFQIVSTSLTKRISNGARIPAGYLLEEVGAKRMRVGKIKIADYHGNLLINSGNGKFNDVKKLAKLLKSRVKRKFGILLEEEIRYL